MSLKPVLLIRGSENERDEVALRELGIATISEPFTEITVGSLTEAKKLLDLVKELEGWVVVTSRNSIPFWAQLVTQEALVNAFTTNPFLKFAAVGKGSAETLNDIGVTEILIANPSDSDELLAALSQYPVSNLFFPVGNLARTTIPDGLRALGWKIHSSLVYLNRPVLEVPAVIDSIKSSQISAIVLRSPSAARALHSFIPNPGIPILCGGPITANQARELGMDIAGISIDPKPESIAELVKQTLESGNR